MAVGFFVKPIFFLVGTGSFLNSLFSTILVKLENRQRGSRFPLIMNNLYNGKVSNTEILAFKKEVAELKNALKKLPPTEIVWDSEDENLSPPWGTNISKDITNMYNYFVTSDGKLLFDKLDEAIEAVEKTQRDLIIKSL